MLVNTSEFGAFILDRERKLVTRGDYTLPLNLRGYTVLETLLDAAGEPVSKQALMDRAWPDTVVEEGSLSVLISNLRKHLGESNEALIVTVPRIGYRLVTPRPSTLSGHGTDSQATGGPPTLAVLPFANHGSAAESGYFADGITDDIIAALARFKAFAVVSRGSTHALRDRASDPRAAAAGLGVRYALEGSIRRERDTLRVTAGLFDVVTGKHLWAERFEGALADVFSFQDRITEAVVGVIEPEIRKAEIERARRKPAASLDAYDLFLQAMPIYTDPGVDRHAEALGLLNRAMELDPNFAPLPAYAAGIYEKRISLRAPPLGNNDAALAIELARRALSLDSSDPLIRAICAWVLFRVDGDETAIDAVRQAVADNPNHVLVLQHAAAVVGMYGAPDEAFEYHARAYRLSPGAPEAFDSLFGMAASKLVMGQNEEAITWALKSLSTFNNLLFTYIALTAAYANLERMEEARAMLVKVRELSPHLTIKLIVDGAAKHDSFAWAVIPGLTKAGLPPG